MRFLKFLVLGLALAVPVTIAIVATATASSPQKLQAAKAAGARYHSVKQALAAGYVADPVCVESPDGGMGIHYINEDLVRDPALDPERPEILLYAPNGDGKLELVALEFMQVDADQNLATDGDRPSIFGQSFDGPMAGHNPTMPVHYDLHVWLYRDNPKGTFAQWNPRVSCP